MAITTESESLRERTRRAVRLELLDAAQELFARRGYEAVTIDDIASVVGLSRRSFFRYFGSKEALVLGKFERQGEQFAEALDARPRDEHPWVSLRRMFDATVNYLDDPELGARAREMQRIIQSSEALRAGYLERMQRAHDVVADRLAERMLDEGNAPTPIAAAALVAAAFSCLTVANAASERGEATFGAALDEAMSAIARGSVSIP
ncbi:MAG: helix-turn-helix domain-containing protein [Microcella sp.]|nr:helix-turn-helix domain-containing protein [Microcella sp.]